MERGDKNEDQSRPFTDVTAYAQVEKGLINRRIFSDSRLYEQELERIFARCWLCLGHESQLSKLHDYFTTYMGEDPVLVTRDRDGRIHAFHNSCRHRGTTICNTDAGNQKLFRCPYHWWTYDSAGKLVSVPRYTSAYNKQLDRKQWGLIEVAQLATFGGLIFATWDAQAPPLTDYLGEMTFYLDLALNRYDDGLTIVGGVHRWSVETNWKIAAENSISDMYHLPHLHAWAVTAGFRNPMGTQGYAIHTNHGHGLGAEIGGAFQGGNLESGYAAYQERGKKRMAERYGSGIQKLVPTGSSLVFPNLFILDSMRFLILWSIQPRGPRLTDIFGWCLVDRGMPDYLRSVAIRQAALTMGPGGLFQVDDDEAWKRCAAGARGVIGRRYPLNYQMGLGDERPASDLFEDLPGQMCERFPNEGNQRAFYRFWRTLMNAPDWPSISAASASASAPNDKRPSQE